MGRSEQVEQQLESSRQAAAAETERLEQQVKDAEKMRDAAMEGDAGAIVEEMKQQLERLEERLEQRLIQKQLQAARRKDFLSAETEIEPVGLPPNLRSTI